VLDDGSKLIFCRNTAAKDINSYIHCDGDTGLMVLQSTRGGGRVHFRSNITGAANPNKPCYSWFDNSDFVNPLTSMYNNGKLSWFDSVSSTEGPLDAKVFAPYNSITASHFLARCYPSKSSTSAYGSQCAAYIWNRNGLGLGSITSLCGMGPHDTASGSNRTRMGLITSTALSYDSGVYNWDGGGVSMYSAGWSTFSDIRLKSNIEASPFGLAEILQLDPVRYALSGDTTGENNGLIAESVLPVLPELITLSGEQNDDPDDPVYLSMDYTMLRPIFVKAVQELSALVEPLTKPLDRIEARPVLKKC